MVRDDKKTTAYWTASALSYADQKGGMTIPSRKLDQIVEIELGFQPLGITSRPALDGDGDDVLVTAYFEPAICRLKVRMSKNGLHLGVDWIRGADLTLGDGTKKRVRVFPDVSQPSGANRAQCALYGPTPGAVWVSRNGEREFHMLTPPAEAGGRWQHIGTTRVDGEADHSVSSAVIVDNVLNTCETSADGRKWWIRRYDQDIGRWRLMEEHEQLDEWRYGISLRNGSNWTVTDYKADAPDTRGIYRDIRRVLPDIWGSGICFLSDGSALVSRYGQSHPGCFNGLPGALIYIPAALLK